MALKYVWVLELGRSTTEGMKTRLWEYVSGKKTLILLRTTGRKSIKWGLALT